MLLLDTPIAAAVRTDPISTKPQQEVQLGPQRKKSKLHGLVEIGSVLTAVTMGVSNRSIGSQMRVGESTIRAIRARYLTRKIGSGHDIREIMKEVRNNPFVSAPEVRLTAGVERGSSTSVPTQYCALFMPQVSSITTGLPGSRSSPL